jgi:hypothetical protein
MPRPSLFSEFYHPHYSGWRVQIMEFLIMMFSPHSCHFVRLRNVSYQIYVFMVRRC